MEIQELIKNFANAKAEADILKQTIIKKQKEIDLLINDYEKLRKVEDSIFKQIGKEEFGNHRPFYQTEYLKGIKLFVAKNHEGDIVTGMIEETVEI